MTHGNGNNTQRAIQMANVFVAGYTDMKYSPGVRHPTKPVINTAAAAVVMEFHGSQTLHTVKSPGNM